MITRAAARSRSDVIRDETGISQNTAVRVGSLFGDVVDSVVFIGDILPFDADLRDFGATSGSDATSAFNDAISDLGAQGGRIIVPAGVWLTSSQIDLPGNIEIVGSKGSIVRKNGTNFNVFRMSGDNNAIRGLELDGNHMAQGSMVFVAGADNTVSDCYIHDNGLMSDGNYSNGSHGVCMDGQSSTCRRNLVVRCRVWNCHDIGVSQHTAPDNRILDNDIAGNGFEGVTIDVTSHRAKVCRNRISANCVRGGVGNIGIDGSELFVITDNHILGALNSLSGVKTQNDTGSSNYGIISDNQILDNGGLGVWLFAGSSGGSDWCCINGNVIRSNSGGSVRLDTGCDNNQVRGNSLNGVGVTNSGSGNTIN